MVRLVGLAPAYGFHEGFLGALQASALGHRALAVAGEELGFGLRDAIGVDRVELQQRERRGHRVVHVLVRQGDVLQHGKELVLTFQALRQLPERI